VATPRPGWSRRAQYGLFFSFIAAIAGLVIGLILLAISIAAPRTFGELRSVALDVTAPLTIPLYEVTATFQGIVSGTGNYWDAARQNARLKAENKAMREQLIVARALQRENRQLKAVLDLRERTAETVATGRLVNGTFEATEILAKHDERYMPREVIDALKQQGTYVDPNAAGAAPATN